MLLCFLLDPFCISFVLHRFGVSSFSCLLNCRAFAFLRRIRSPLFLCLMFLLLVGSLFFSFKHCQVPLFYWNFPTYAFLTIRHLAMSGIYPLSTALSTICAWAPG